jgi:hypothetical protein
MSEDAFPCPLCLVGYCQPGTGTYLRVVGDILVSAPDMPAWTCDVCNYQEFEQEAVLRLDMLLGQPDEPSSDSQRVSTKLQPPDTLAPRRAKP